MIMRTIRMVLVCAAAVGTLVLGPAVQASRRTQPSAGPARPPLVGVDHVAFKISDAAAAREFYGELLGYPVVTPRDSAGPLIARISSRQSLVLEPGLRADEDDRLSHIAFATSELASMKAYLESRGVVVEGPARQRCGRDALRTKDPDGNAIEFVQEDVLVSTPPDSARQPLSTRLYHTGAAVRDEARAHAFYKDVLGMEETWRGGANPTRIQWVNMRVPDGTDYLEYMLNDAPPTRQQLGSQHHACLLVPDIQAAWETVRSRTPAARRGALQKPRIGRNNKWQLNLFDRDGTRVELMEPFPTRTQ
jgi:catechol 2,3-dioxygenase-like lactoylglutathione lyase family enzyme